MVFPSFTENSTGTGSKNMETVHKKNDRLHIYVRQDKYKGELKSHNWVGRTYINGKQKIISSGTTDLEKATVILEKWFDDLQLEKTESKDIPEIKNTINEKEEKGEIVDSNQSDSTPTTITSSLSKFEKLKKIIIPSLSSDKKNTPNTDLKKTSKKNVFKNFLDNFLKNKIGKMSVVGEEVVGVDITQEAIRVAQVSKDKNDKWILDKFSYRVLDKEKIGDNLINSKDYLSEELNLALANAKITTKNVALSIPVTSAVVNVVTSPLMTDEEMKRAIETDSLWENLLQMDDINDYSIFHQVIDRNSKKAIMDILFVASKLSDVNAYSSIIKKAGLNPVIMDVRCFSLKNALDNIKLNNENITQSAILEIGLNENYLMIVHNNTPIVKDIFLKPQEKQTLAQARGTQHNNPELEDIIRRYCMQIKQILNEYENKYQTKINTINVVSVLKGIKHYIPMCGKNLINTKFKLFDPLVSVSIPTYNQEKIDNENKSSMASVMGLAYRKLDIFGYYKFVTAVRNINLLPNRDTVRQQNKIKFLSGFAFKGVAGAILSIYLILIITSFFQIRSNNEKLLAFDAIEMEFNKISKIVKNLNDKKELMEKSLGLGKMVKSNQAHSFISLAQVSRSVPQRVKFTKITFDGSNSLVVEGDAVSDQDILNFIANLNAKSSIVQASLDAMKNKTGDQGSFGSNYKKEFTISCKLKMI